MNVRGVMSGSDVSVEVEDDDGDELLGWIDDGLFGDY